MISRDNPKSIEWVIMYYHGIHRAAKLAQIVKSINKI